VRSTKRSRLNAVRYVYRSICRGFSQPRPRPLLFQTAPSPRASIYTTRPAPFPDSRLLPLPPRRCPLHHLHLGRAINQQEFAHRHALLATRAGSEKSAVCLKGHQVVHSAPSTTFRQFVFVRELLSASAMLTRGLRERCTTTPHVRKKMEPRLGKRIEQAR
jgi:hypothetical protein